MTVTAESVLLLLGAGATVATSIFWGAFYMGRIHSRLAEHDDRLNDLDREIKALGLRP